MTISKGKHIKYHLGFDTLTELVGCGLGPIAVGVNALYENGVVPGEIFDAKKLKACGLTEHLVKKIIRQCQGENFKPSKQNDAESKKLKKLSDMEEYYFELQYLEHLHEELLKNHNNYPNLDLILQGMRPDQVPEQFRERYERLNQKPREFIPPEPSIVKELFSKFTYENGSEPLDLTVKRVRGRPSKTILRLPFPDQLRQVMNISNADEEQKHCDTLRGKKTVKALKDALHLEWFRSQPAERLNKGIPMVELCDIQGDSHNTIRARNKRHDITPKHNFFTRNVKHHELLAMFQWHRGDNHLELDLSPHQSTEHVNNSSDERLLRRYALTFGGWARAKDEWKKAGSPGNFDQRMKIRGYLANSYELPKSEPPQ